MLITIIILILSAVFFVNGKVRSDIVALCALIALLVFQILTPDEALSGFSNSVVIMMIGLFVVGGAIFQTGQTISYLVRNKDKWITANYKETQIANIYIGQQVRVKVDALPGKIFNGEVTAISEATGSKYSLVPTDNSAGNFVKVQQRIPVRIELENISTEEMAQLRAGMMVETEALRK